MSIISRDQAQRFLEQNTVANLAVLGALLFEPVEAVYGVEQAGHLAAVSVVVAEEANIPDSLPTVLVSGSDTGMLAALVHAGRYPTHATWIASTPASRDTLAAQFEHTDATGQGMVYFGADPQFAGNQGTARLLTSADTGLDLSPCSLGVIALSYWLVRGWHVFGVVEGGRLLGHSVAAYPIATTEEVSAVFTAPEARRRGVASACTAATIANIQSRGKQAVYVSRKSNTASIRVAEGLGLRRLFETWELVT